MPRIDADSYPHALRLSITISILDDKVQLRAKGISTWCFMSLFVAHLGGNNCALVCLVCTCRLQAS